MIHVTAHGTLQNSISISGVVKTSCDQWSFKTFPSEHANYTIKFDTHTLPSDVSFHLISVGVDSIGEDFISIDEVWRFNGIYNYTDSYAFMYASNEYVSTMPRFGISVSRKQQYYHTIITIPVNCLNVVQLMVLLLPAGTYDRSTFSITVLLSFSVTLNSVYHLFPQTSETVYLVVYVCAKLFFSTFITIYTMITAALLHHLSLKNKDQNANKKIRIADFVFGLSLLLTSCAIDLALLFLIYF